MTPYKKVLDWIAIEKDVREATDLEYGPAKPTSDTFVKSSYIAERVLASPALYPGFVGADARQARARVTIVMKNHMKWAVHRRARGCRGSGIFVRPRADAERAV